MHCIDSQFTFTILVLNFVLNCVYSGEIWYARYFTDVILFVNVNFFTTLLIRVLINQIIIKFSSHVFDTRSV